MAAFLATLSEPGWARPWRPAQIPNGSVLGCAACHLNPGGGGTRNDFGNAVFNELQRLYGNPFGNTQPFWFAELAGMDSDGDGFTNGQELGDPAGMWRPGSPNPSGPVSNPGDDTSTPPNAPPTVALTAPAPGASLTGPTVGVILTASAGDTDGTVTNVQFFDGAASLGSDSTLPFGIRVNLGVGSHTLTARATDNRAAVTTSSPVTVTVTQPPLIASTPTAIRSDAGGVELSWPGGSGPFAVQRRAALSEPWCTVMPITTARSVLMPTSSQSGFFRIVDMSLVGPVPCSASLSGAAERPNPVTTAASGQGTLRLEGNTLSIDITYANLSGPAIGAHLHGPADTTQPAGVLVDFAPFNGGSFGTSGRLLGSVVLTPDEKAALLSGLTYVNIHTDANKSGEIRGQVTPDLSAIMPCISPSP